MPEDYARGFRFVHLCSALPRCCVCEEVMTAYGCCRLLAAPRCAGLCWVVVPSSPCKLGDAGKVIGLELSPKAGATIAAVALAALALLL